MNEHFIVAFYMRLTACRKGDAVKTAEEILKHYIDGESESPVIQFMQMTSNREINITSPTSERVKTYLDAEEAKTHNPILDQYK